MIDPEKMRLFMQALKPDLPGLARQVFIENPQKALRELPGKLQASRDLLNQYEPGKGIDPRLMDQFMNLTGFAPMGMTAYHGSPYLFRMFDRSKIGTGEGAQSYGVGAGYTAEARPVASSYLPTTSEEIAQKINVLEPELDKFKSYLRVAKKMNSPDIKVLSEKINELKTQIEQTKKSAGYLYKGDIPDEILPKFLDWDKPLKDQPEILKAIRSNITDKDLLKSFDYNVDKGMAGANAYKNWITGGKTDAERSAILENLGVRGIRYLDQGSRGQGKGTSNFIPFRPEDYKIQEINDIPLEEWIRKGLL